jgi:hypothetical protein
MDKKECPFCAIMEHKSVILEQRQTSIGMDFFYCPSCETAIGQPFKNPGEVEKWCYDCATTTVHTDLGNCKCCGRKGGGDETRF